MSIAASPPPALGAGAAVSAATRQQIRGSSLLLAGRISSVVAKMGAQVLVVRYLSTSEYGAWAYGLAAVAFLGGFAHLSLDRAVGRFASIYHEARDYDRFFGTVTLVLLTVAATGALFVGGVHLLPDFVARLTGGDPLAAGLLLVMVFLVPLEALDALLIALFATFGRPSAIFIRRYLVTPAVQVGVVLMLIALQADVYFLAIGYVVGALMGACVSLVLLLGIFREQDLFWHLGLRRIRMPVRELFAFSVPLMTSDWLTVLTHSSGALLLGYLYTTEHVALFRVVMPLAMINQLVIQSFHVLYIPIAARLFARGDTDAIYQLYWQTTLWIAVLTFPLFAVTFAAAKPLTMLLFGARYEAAGPVLAVLVAGQYVQAALGFNGATIKVLGRVRLLVGINLAGAVLNVALTLALIPFFGVMGAAVAQSATVILHNVLKQLGLRAGGGFPLLNPAYVQPVRTLVLGCAAVIAAPIVGIAGGPWGFVWGGLVAGWVVARTRRVLNAGEVFPDLTRHPLIRRVLA